MQRLRQQRDVDRRVPDRQLLELAALPDRRSTRGGAARAPRALEHDVRAIDGDDARRPARRFDRQVAFAAAEIGDLERRQQQAERARPRGPAPARHELPRVARVGARVRVESSPCAAAALPAAALRRRGRRHRRPTRRTAPRAPVHSGALPRRSKRRRQPVVGEAGVLLLDDEAGVLQQPEMARDARLRQAEDAGELGDVQPLARQHAQQAQPRLVAEQPVERRGLLHIYKSTCIDGLQFPPGVELALASS